MARKLTKADFKIPVLLVILSLVPLLGGIVRMISIAPHAAVTPENARFVGSRVPIIFHVVSAVTFSLLGAFQFSAGLRARFPTWHRSAGRWLAAFGLVAALSGLWMTAFYPIPRGMQGPLLYWVRLAVGSAMFASIVLAWRSILERRVARHEAFMIRAYALGQGAGTQVLVLGPWTLLTGESLGLTRDLLMTLSWVINILVAEAIIRARTKTARVAPAAHAPHESDAIVHGLPSARSS
jgi:hypothetical protein